MCRVLILSLGLLVATASVAGAKPGVGLLYYDGGIVRTIVPPAAMPKPGIDDLFVVTNGVATQLPIAAVAPGDRDYHGGKWAFHSVTWNVMPYPLLSASAVHAAAAEGYVTITRVPENDFKCPIQPTKGGMVPE